MSAIEWIACDGETKVSDSKGELVGWVWAAISDGRSYGWKFKNEVRLCFWDDLEGCASEDFMGNIVAVSRAEIPEFPSEFNL